MGSRTPFDLPMHYLQLAICILSTKEDYGATTEIQKLQKGTRPPEVRTPQRESERGIERPGAARGQMRGVESERSGAARGQMRGVESERSGPEAKGTEGSPATAREAQAMLEGVVATEAQGEPHEQDIHAKSETFERMLDKSKSIQQQYLGQELELERKLGLYSNRGALIGQ